MKKVAIPPMVSDIIENGVININGFLFDSHDICPHCGGELKNHDIKKKKFVTMQKNGEPENITVNIRRLRCRNCKKLVYADSPFYDNIRLGSPIVDFCTLNLRIHPANHISKILRSLNILVNPSTIRSLKKNSNPGDIPYIEFHGILFPLSLLNISESLRNEEISEGNMLIFQMTGRNTGTKK
ncbi:hypothetical protein J2128_000610 [Methanomicrobium sp. W14]|uniref:DUF6431 domain-containing protein n=1 Tax=Methanomicrobium sp. W14 TaxID=2817839 RepID=UPI001AE940B8|nr:DUF6431 domain-containing protein [Methanomicrobium sp. W14]MBP2132689.1 hypothetical protein [Methanomicrobium sp. W14]